MEKYYYVFIVVVYKNYKDLISFSNSLNRNLNNKVIVVDNFFSSEVSEELKKICYNSNFDYVPNNNNGYGGGNNKGIDFAIKHYKFEYLIVSNPDIEIISLPSELPEMFSKGILGPEIISSSGRNQNPFLICDIPLRDFLLYKGYMKNNITLINLGFFFSRLLKFMFLTLKIKKDFYRPFAIHGSFFLISSNALFDLCPVFDERFFIFCEEQDLAKRCKELKIPVFYSSLIRVHHKEDGSMKLTSKQVISNYARESTMKFYEKWYK